MAKITTGILVFRKTNCTDWTSDLDAQMNAWVQQYTTWLETASIALQEAFSSKLVPKQSSSIARYLTITHLTQQPWLILLQPIGVAQALVERH